MQRFRVLPLKVLPQGRSSGGCRYAHSLLSHQSHRHGPVFYLYYLLVYLLVFINFTVVSLAAMDPCFCVENTACTRGAGHDLWFSPLLLLHAMHVQGGGRPFNARRDRPGAGAGAGFHLTWAPQFRAWGLGSRV